MTRFPSAKTPADSKATVVMMRTKNFPVNRGRALKIFVPSNEPKTSTDTPTSADVGQTRGAAGANNPGGRHISEARLAEAGRLYECTRVCALAVVLFVRARHNFLQP